MDYEYENHDQRDYYREATSQVTSMYKEAWMHKTRGTTRFLQDYRHEDGAAPLEQMVLRTLLAYLKSLEASALRDVPWTVAKKIWNAAHQNQLVSTAWWATLIEVYGREEALRPLLGNRRYRADSLNDIVSEPIAPIFNIGGFLTILSIEDIGFVTRATYFSISSLPNLGALMITQAHGALNQSEMDDRIIWAWKKAVCTTNCFPKLTLLVLRYLKGISGEALKHLRHFPALAYCDLSGCYHAGFLPVDSVYHGWKVHARINVLESSLNSQDRDASGRHTKEISLSSLCEACLQHQKSVDEQMHALGDASNAPPLLKVTYGNGKENLKHSTDWLERVEDEDAREESKNIQSNDLQRVKDRRRVEKRTVRPGKAKHLSDMLKHMY